MINLNELPPEPLGHAIMRYARLNNCTITNAADRVFGILNGSEAVALDTIAALWPSELAALPDSHPARNGRERAV